MASDLELTEEQQNKILAEWNNRPTNPPSLLDLVKLAFPDVPDADGRSVHGRAIKKFLSTRQIRARAAYEYIPKETLQLTEEQKEYISNNCATMRGFELAREIFKNPNLSNLHQETQIVLEYMKTLPSQVKNIVNVEDYGEYKPPTTFNLCFYRINANLNNSLDKEKLTGTQKMGVEMLISYLHTYRFLNQINQYHDNVDRQLFESSFIRYTYDKPDLTQEEVDQYIILSTEVVISNSIQKTIIKLQEQLDNEYEETGKMPMAIIEHINYAREEYNKSIQRQQKLIDSLKEKRSDRLKKQKQDNASIANLFDYWKQEESRNQLIKFAEHKKQALKEGIEQITTMDEIKARIMGIDEDTILNG